ncbi:cystatin-12-like [Castor canadensis]|uniref:Cystatin-12-like n=1 Tax=Castor canadensis TaxID=51338 RepID=A0A8C0WB56_CASCN|nr:cystatin-12-like [Castor canadensis]
MLWKVPLMVELILLGTHIYSCEFVDIDKNTQGFAISVEFVVHKFNEDQDDEFAYKFLRVRRSQYKILSSVYLIDVEMGRTICKKHDEDIDNCPLQQGPGEKKVRCTYIVETEEWFTQFTVLNSTCQHT